MAVTAHDFDTDEAVLAYDHDRRATLDQVNLMGYRSRTTVSTETGIPIAELSAVLNGSRRSRRVLDSIKTYLGAKASA